MQSCSLYLYPLTTRIVLIHSCIINRRLYIHHDKLQKTVVAEWKLMNGKLVEGCFEVQLKFQ